MFAYCNNNPANCYDIEGKQAVRNKMLMTCDSFHSTQGTAALNYYLLQKCTPDEKYFLSPAYCVSGNMETSPHEASLKGTAAISMAHGVLRSDDSALSMTIDVLSAEASGGITNQSLEASTGVYFAKGAIEIRIADGIVIELGVSLGYGKKFSISKQGVKLGNTAFVGWHVAVVWGEQEEYTYFAE